MQVLLLVDVQNQGKKGDVIKVSDGYARNYLIPRKLAKELTPALLTDLEKQKAARERKLEAQRAEFRKLADQVQALTVVIKVQTGAGGKLYGSITAKDVVDELKARHGIELDKRKLIMPASVKAFGKYEVEVRYCPEVTGKLNLIVEGKE